VTQPSTPHRADRLRAPEFFLLAAELAVVLLLIRSYRLEQDLGLTRLLPVVFVGFIVHAWAPKRLRLPLFLAVSLTAFMIFLSPVQAVALVGLGLILIAICHLPIPFGARVAVLIVAGIGLAAIRAEWISIPWKTIPTIVLPVLGAMFMFRLIVYMYDLRHEKQPVSVWQRLSYFFLLPNICFLLFPVVDYSTFKRTYYSADETAIYQKGIRWMFRGVVHLLMYRLVYLYMVIPPHEVSGLPDVIRYTTSFWLLYMRVSGQFHIAIGILCLFGFNLPETNRLYYLTSSFTDLWRRANIYWKDFMQKVFYYPMFTRLKRYGTLSGVLLATVAIFVVTWLLHSYQWFWLRGEFPLRRVDLVFWGLIGAGVVFNVWREMSGTKRGRLSRPSFSLSRATTHALKALGMFIVMSILWSFWSSASVAELLDVLATAGRSPAGDFGLLGIALVAIVALGVVAQYLAGTSWPAAVPGRLSSRAPASFVTAALALLILAQPGVQGRVWGPVGAVAASFGYAGKNEADEERETLGYYEDLLDAGWQSRGAPDPKPADWVTLEETSAVRATDDLRGIEFVPGYEGSFKRKTLRTNRWGMRDREYEREKPPGTFRIAVLGGSYTMGSGVEGEETFENLVEDRLNRESGIAPYERVELMNFAMAGFSVLQSMRLLDLKVLDFDPDMILCVVHVNEDVMVSRALRASIVKGRDLGYPWLEDLVTRSGARDGMSTVKLQRELEPYVPEVMEGALRTIAESARRSGAIPVVLYVPLTNEDITRSVRRRNEVLGMARRAGAAVLSVEDAFAGFEGKDLVVATWDTHPNALAHSLIADRIVVELERERESIGIAGTVSALPETEDHPKEAR
jgi:hypothetical protein